VCGESDTAPAAEGFCCGSDSAADDVAADDAGVPVAADGSAGDSFGPTAADGIDSGCDGHVAAGSSGDCGCAADNLAADCPGTERLDAERLDAERLAADCPGTERLDAERPDTNRSGAAAERPASAACPDKTALLSHKAQ
jgi:hypothetical protein